jgi:hypothetical protein
MQFFYNPNANMPPIAKTAQQRAVPSLSGNSFVRFSKIQSVLFILAYFRFSIRPNSHMMGIKPPLPDWELSYHVK